MAGRYICPVCDRRLKMKHFCTYCKSFVREPVFYTGPVANEHYDENGRPGCMADQHYGLGHVHGPGDGQREYGHNRAGKSASGRRVYVQNRQHLSGRVNIQNGQYVSGRQNGGTDQGNFAERPGRDRKQNRAETVLNGRSVSDRMRRRRVRGIQIMLLLTVLVAGVRFVWGFVQYYNQGLPFYIDPGVILVSAVAPFIPFWVLGSVILLISRKFR